MNSRFRNALVFALLLPFASMAAAEARPGGSSFRGGFSSQKSSAARSAPSKQPSFGSFGARRPDAAPARSADTPARGGSAMSRDLDRSAAQDRAVRNWDSRRDASAASGANAAGSAAGSRAANGATPPLPPLNPVLPGGANAAGRSGSPGFGPGDARTAGAGTTTSGGAGGYGQQSPAPVVIRERSGSNAWLWGIGGYLLGSQAMSHAKDAPPAPSQPSAQGAPTIDTDATPTGAAASAAGGTAQSDPAAVVATPEPGAAQHQPAPQATEYRFDAMAEANKERSSVRTLTWALLIFGFAWLLYIGWRKVKAGKKHANYSFERN